MAGVIFVKAFLGMRNKYIQTYQISATQQKLT